MVNDCTKRCYTKSFFTGKRYFSLNTCKAKNEKKKFFVETLDQFQRLEVREKARNEATRLIGYLPSHIQRVLME